MPRPRPGTIDVFRDGHLWILAVHGEHDLSTTPSLRDELDNVFDAGSRCIVDLTDAEFIESTLLRALAYRCARAEGDTLAIVAPTGGLPRRLVTLTGVDKTIPTYEARAEALAAWNDA
jgi:anti-sigma B factor antagonist